VPFRSVIIIKLTTGNLSTIEPEPAGAAPDPAPPVAQPVVAIVSTDEVEALREKEERVAQSYSKAAQQEILVLRR
jgi:hypothetical protein